MGLVNAPILSMWVLEARALWLEQSLGMIHHKKKPLEGDKLYK